MSEVRVLGNLAAIGTRRACMLIRVDCHAKITGLRNTRAHVFFSTVKGGAWLTPAPNVRDYMEHAKEAVALDYGVDCERNQAGLIVQLVAINAMLWREIEAHGEHDPESCGCSYVGLNMWDCGHIDGLTPSDYPQSYNDQYNELASDIS